MYLLAMVASAPAIAHIATGKYQDLGWFGVFVCGVALAEIKHRRHEIKNFKLEDNE